MTNYTQSQDPWEVASNPPPPTFDVWGKVEINPWFCMLQKGIGKVPYDPDTLDEKGNPVRRYTAIDLTILPLDANRKPMYRQYLAEFGDWVELTLPSLHDLGITNLQTLHGKWAHAELIPNGSKFTNKTTGEEMDSTTFKFLQIFDTEADCLAAQNGGAPQQQPATTSNNGDKQRETALKFLKPYAQNAWRKSDGDLDKARAELSILISTQKLLAQYFTVDSPEVADALAEAMQ